MSSFSGPQGHSSPDEQREAEKVTVYRNHRVHPQRLRAGSVGSLSFPLYIWSPVDLQPSPIPLCNTRIRVPHRRRAPLTRRGLNRRLSTVLRLRFKVGHTCSVLCSVFTVKCCHFSLRRSQQIPPLSCSTAEWKLNLWGHISVVCACSLLASAECRGRDYSRH